MDSIAEKPMVSIGVPVFNEGNFLELSLNALAHQDYANIEIIVSDNGSHDNTESICKKFKDKFKFINFHQFDKNMGIAVNSSYVLEKSTGKYFMWASGHDLWDSNYISECVDLLENTPGALIAFGSSSWIDSDGTRLQRQFGWIDTRGLDVISRYIVTFWGNMHPILGVINREALVSHKIVNTPGADMIILCRLSLQGDFVHAARTSWSRREIRNEATYREKLSRYKSSDFGMRESILSSLLPLAKLPIALLKDILTSHQPFWIKFILLFLLLAMFPAKYAAGKFLANQN